MATIFYIDPQSYNNLSIYDKGVLSNMPKGLVEFFGNRQWNVGTMDNCKCNLLFNYKENNSLIVKVLKYLLAFFKIYLYTIKRKPAIVHIQWIKIPIIDLMFFKLLKARNIKVVFTAHNVLPHNTGDRYKNEYKRIYSLCDRVIVHSLKTKLEIQNTFDLNPDKVVVIPHGIISIPVSEHEVSHRMTELKHKYGIDRKIVITSLGNQSYYKGVDLLLEVWSDYFKSNTNLHLIIAGVNQGLDYSNTIGTNITIINEKLSNLDFLAFLKMTDIIILPYRKISQSGVLFSAINYDIPVIVSNAGGLPEPLGIGNIGWNMGEANKYNLAQVLMRISSSPDEIKKKSNPIEFKKVKTYYSWETISFKTLELYRSLL